MEKINKFIEQNIEYIYIYLEKQLIQFRKLFGTEISNPWYLCNALNFEMSGDHTLDEKVKTILTFEKTTPEICYNNKLNSSELNFYVMKEFIYYLIILSLPSEFRFKNFFMKSLLLHSNTTDTTQKENMVEQILDEYALKFLESEKTFEPNYKNIKKCSEYFEI